MLLRLLIVLAIVIRALPSAAAADPARAAEPCCCCCGDSCGCCDTPSDPDPGPGCSCDVPDDHRPPPPQPTRPTRSDERLDRSCPHPISRAIIRPEDSTPAMRIAGTPRPWRPPNSVLLCELCVWRT